MVTCLSSSLKSHLQGVAVALGSSPAGRTRGLTPSSSTGAAPRDLSRYQLDLKVYRQDLCIFNSEETSYVMHFAPITEPVQFSDLGSHGSLETGGGGRQNPELVTIIGTLTLLLLHAAINQKYS